MSLLNYYDVNSDFTIKNGYFVVYEYETDKPIFKYILPEDREPKRDIETDKPNEV